MYIATIPNRNSPPAILLRESYREKGKVKNRTLANLSSLPPQSIDVLRRSLKGESLVSTDVLEIVEDGSPAHGHVDAVMRAMRRLDFSRVICSRRSRRRDLVVAMVAARILEPKSKLATTLWWEDTTLPEMLGVRDADEDDLYDTMDWLLERQDRIENKLAGRHLKNNALALYDLTSSMSGSVVSAHQSVVASFDLGSRMRAATMATTKSRWRERLEQISLEKFNRLMAVITAST